MNFLDRRETRPITESPRAGVVEDLPELVDIADAELRTIAIEAC